MSLFEREEAEFGTDAPTRALSVTAVETEFVAGVYEKLATVYDLVFGPALHPGRLVALERMGIKPADRVLEGQELRTSLGRYDRVAPGALDMANAGERSPLGVGEQGLR